MPTWFFFHRGKRLGRATGWHGLGQFEAAVAVAREKVLAKAASSAMAHSGIAADSANPKAAGD